MSMERLKELDTRLISLLDQGLSQDVSTMDAKELGEVADMVKDISEAKYYCSITDAMEKTDDPWYYMDKYLPESRRNYRPIYPMMPYYNDGSDYMRGYSGGNGGGNSGGGSSGNSSGSGGTSNGGSRGYTRYYNPYESMRDIRDIREGRSGEYRRNYMEMKERHQSDVETMKELERYIKELGEDITEMIEGATPQEKTMLKQKIATLASKIV